MMLTERPRSLVAGLALVVCALAPCACTLQASGLTSPDASAAGSGGGGAAGGPTGAGGAGSAASSVDAASVSASASSASSSGSGGGAPQDPCGPLSTLDFQDNFDDDMRNLLVWEAYAETSIPIHEQGQQVIILMSGGKLGDDAGYKSKISRSLIACHAHIEVKQVVNSDAGGTGQVFFRLNGGPGQHLEFRQKGNEMKLTSIISYDEQSDTIDFSPSSHRWWRFHESGGEITWETSPDGQTWLPQRTLATEQFGSVDFLALEFGAVSGSQNNSDAQFDNVNTIPGSM
jgi:hypothetical protein